MRKPDYKWGLLAMLSAAYLLAQGTRQTYGAVLPQIGLDFASSGGSDTQLGLVGGIFTLVFGIMGPFAGFAADTLQRKWLVVGGLALFSTGILSSGFAVGVGSLLLAYGVVNGLGQALMPPAISSLIGQYHVKTRATAFSISQSAIYAGIVGCSCLSGWLAGLGDGGWRLAFRLIGAGGVILALVLAFTLRPAPPCGGGSGPEKASAREALRVFLRNRSALLLTLGLGMFQFVTYGFRMWLPKFMLTSFAGTTPASVGFHSVFWLYAGAFIGVMAGGRWSDAVYGHRPVIRFEIPFIGFLACAPLSLAVAYSPSPALCGLAVFVFGFATGFYDSNLFTSLFEVVHPRYRAAAVGLFCLGGAIFGGALGPFVLGWLSANFSIRLAIASLAAFALVGAATILAVRCLTFGNDRIGHDGRNVARGS